MPELTYQRDVAHCGVSPYIKTITIDSIKPADNSDNLEVVRFVESGWQVVAKNGIYQPGQQVTFLPCESVLPFEFSEELGVTQYLHKGKVTVVKPRGNRSEGLIVDEHTVEPYRDKILLWETPPTVEMSGNQLAASEYPLLDFPEFYKMPHIQNEPWSFSRGQIVYVSEKLQGTNCRFGLHKHPQTGENQFYVGTHRTVLQESDTNLYWRVIREHVKDPNKLPLGTTFYGEIYGKGIQNLTYGVAPRLIVFAAFRDGRYLTVDKTRRLCAGVGLPTVHFSTHWYEDIELAVKWASGLSMYTDAHIREGIVMRESAGDFVAAKCLNPDYLAMSGRTERH